jgi:hypothetical protein
MSIPITCKDCGKMIGSGSALWYNHGCDMTPLYFQKSCGNKREHAEPIRTETKKWFGLYYKIVIYYPETGTSSIYNEVKSRSKFRQRLAMLLSCDDIFTPDGWEWRGVR